MNKFDKNNIDIEKLFTYLLLLAVYAISIKEMYGIHYTTADDVVAELYQNYFTLNEAIEKGFRITYILNNSVSTCLLPKFEPYVEECCEKLAHLKNKDIFNYKIIHSSFNEHIIS